MAGLIRQLFGLAIPKQAELEEEQVTAEMTGVRQIFDETISPNLNPTRMARILRDAAEGNLHDFLTMAEEMEEREMQYRTVLSTRKAAVKGIEPFIKSPTEDKADIAIADAVRDELVDRPEFNDLIGDLLDALGKGYSVAEIIWRLDGTRWHVDCFEHRDPRLFHFDKATRQHLRIRVQGDQDGRELAPFKFIVHIPKLKSGIPARNGLARLAAWSYLLKSYSLKDWAQFLEVHGMPLRVGKYGQTAGPKERSILLKAVRNLGSDAAAIIPDDMSIEFVEVKGFSEKPFEGFSKYLDEQMSKAIVGQTMTTDAGGSRAQAEVHDKVRIDIKEDDARQLATTLNEHLIVPWVALNFGVQKRYPLLTLPVMEREDLAVHARAVSELIDRGLEIEQAEVRDKIGYREPASGAKLMRPRATSGQTLPDPETATNSRYRINPRHCARCAELAANGQLPEDEADRLIAAELHGWERVMAPIMEAIIEQVRLAKNYQELDQRLDRLAVTLPVDQLAERLAILGMKARGNGFTGEID